MLCVQSAERAENPRRRLSSCCGLLGASARSATLCRQPTMCADVMREGRLARLRSAHHLLDRGWSSALLGRHTHDSFALSSGTVTDAATLYDARHVEHICKALATKLEWKMESCVWAPLSPLRPLFGFACALWIRRCAIGCARSADDLHGFAFFSPPLGVASDFHMEFDPAVSAMATDSCQELELALGNGIV